MCIFSTHNSSLGTTKYLVSRSEYTYWRCGFLNDGFIVCVLVRTPSVGRGRGKCHKVTFNMYVGNALIVKRWYSSNFHLISLEHMEKKFRPARSLGYQLYASCIMAVPFATRYSPCRSFKYLSKLQTEFIESTYYLYRVSFEKKNVTLLIYSRRQETLSISMLESVFYMI